MERIVITIDGTVFYVIEDYLKQICNLKFCQMKIRNIFIDKISSFG